MIDRLCTGSGALITFSWALSCLDEGMRLEAFRKSIFKIYDSVKDGNYIPLQEGLADADMRSAFSHQDLSSYGYNFTEFLGEKRFVLFNQITLNCALGVIGIAVTVGLLYQTCCNNKQKVS